MPGTGSGAAPWRTCVLDALADTGIDALPVPERPVEDPAAHASEELPTHLFHQTVALGVVEDLADQGPRLGEVVVLGMERVGAAHHVAIDRPRLFGRRLAVGPGPAFGVGA